MSEVKTVRPGFEWWDRFNQLQAYSFLLNASGGVGRCANKNGDWVEKYEAGVIVDDAQSEINVMRADRDAALAREAALQARLAVADQRVDELESALKHLVHNVKATGKRLDLGLAMEVAEQTLKGADQ